MIELVGTKMLLSIESKDFKGLQKHLNESRSDATCLQVAYLFLAMAVERCPGERVIGLLTDMANVLRLGFPPITVKDMKEYLARGVVPVSAVLTFCCGECDIEDGPALFPIAGIPEVLAVANDFLGDQLLMEDKSLGADNSRENSKGRFEIDL